VHQFPVTFQSYVRDIRRWRTGFGYCHHQVATSQFIQHTERKCDWFRPLHSPSEWLWCYTSFRYGVLSLFDVIIHIISFFICGCSGLDVSEDQEELGFLIRREALHVMKSWICYLKKNWQHGFVLTSCVYEFLWWCYIFQTIGSRNQETLNTCPNGYESLSDNVRASESHWKGLKHFSKDLR
jgi:hypothetical protein